MPRVTRLEDTERGLPAGGGVGAQGAESCLCACFRSSFLLVCRGLRPHGGLVEFLAPGSSPSCWMSDLSPSLCLPDTKMNKHLKILLGLFYRPCPSLRISRPGPQPAAEQPLSLPGASGKRLLLPPVCVLWSGGPSKAGTAVDWAKQSSPRIAQEPE